jgi:hypothetical protein
MSLTCVLTFQTHPLNIFHSVKEEDASGKKVGHKKRNHPAVTIKIENIRPDDSLLCHVLGPSKIKEKDGPKERNVTQDFFSNIRYKPREINKAADVVREEMKLLTSVTFPTLKTMRSSFTTSIFSSFIFMFHTLVLFS